jgi:hypothetical protein
MLPLSANALSRHLLESAGRTLLRFRWSELDPLIESWPFVRCIDAPISLFSVVLRVGCPVLRLSIVSSLLAARQIF